MERDGKRWDGKGSVGDMVGELRVRYLKVGTVGQCTVGVLLVWLLAVGEIMTDGGAGAKLLRPGLRFVWVQGWLVDGGRGVEASALSTTIPLTLIERTAESVRESLVIETVFCLLVNRGSVNRSLNQVTNLATEWHETAQPLHHGTKTICTNLQRLKSSTYLPEEVAHAYISFLVIHYATARS